MFYGERIKVPRYSFIFVETNYNSVIVPAEIHESYPGKNIYREDSKFSDRSSGQTVLTEISLLLRNRSDYGLYSCHSVCTLL